MVCVVPKAAAAAAGSTPFPPEPVTQSGSLVGQFTVNWPTPTLNVDGSAATITNYYVRWGPNAGEQYKGGPSEIAGRIATVAGGTNTKTVTIAAGTQHITVAPENSAGEGSESNELTVTVT